MRRAEETRGWNVRLFNGRIRFIWIHFAREEIEGINVHKYGAHIFHTNNQKVRDYITQFAIFDRFTNSPVANYKGELYPLPFNEMWRVAISEEAVAKINEQRKEIKGEPQKLEEQALLLVGRGVYEKLVKGTQKSSEGEIVKTFLHSSLKISQLV